MSLEGSGDTPLCPYCAERLVEAAATCPFCQETLSTAPVSTEEVPAVADDRRRSRAGAIGVALFVAGCLVAVAAVGLRTSVRPVSSAGAAGDDVDAADSADSADPGTGDAADLSTCSGLVRGDVCVDDEACYLAIYAVSLAAVARDPETYAPRAVEAFQMFGSQASTDKAVAAVYAVLDAGARGGMSGAYDEAQRQTAILCSDPDFFRDVADSFYSS